MDFLTKMKKIVDDMSEIELSELEKKALEKVIIQKAHLTNSMNEMSKLIFEINQLELEIWQQIYKLHNLDRNKIYKYNPVSQTLEEVEQ